MTIYLKILLLSFTIYWDGLSQFDEGRYTSETEYLEFYPESGKVEFGLSILEYCGGKMIGEGFGNYQTISDYVIINIKPPIIDCVCSKEPSKNTEVEFHDENGVALPFIDCQLFDTKGKMLENQSSNLDGRITSIGSDIDSIFINEPLYSNTGFKIKRSNLHKVQLAIDVRLKGGLVILKVSDVDSSLMKFKVLEYSETWREITSDDLSYLKTSSLLTHQWHYLKKT